MVLVVRNIIITKHYYYRTTNSAMLCNYNNILIKTQAKLGLGFCISDFLFYLNKLLF